jgi:hypothetical protein
VLVNVIKTEVKKFEFENSVPVVDDETRKAFAAIDEGTRDPQAS